jgi:superfamily II DNA or RNA helicase
MEFKYKIGLSATLERMDDNHYKIMKAFDYNIFSYTPKQALVDGVLNPFNFSNISVKMDEEDYELYLRLTEEYNALILSGGSFNKIMRGNSGLKFRLFAKMNDPSRPGCTLRESRALLW